MALQHFSLTTSHHPHWKTISPSIRAPTLNFPISINTSKLQSPFCTSKLPLSSSNPQSSITDGGPPEPEGLVEDLRVPDHWLTPSNALQESEWLRITLHKWLDDEYCPETTNIEISKVAAKSYYESLVAKQSDIGDILLKMARDLETISYQESFHGAFSSANAAISLITSRMEQLQNLK
ncbi:hypothetical protein ACHQM5_026792 [Ranunculus cassubicifolius]